MHDRLDSIGETNEIRSTSPVQGICLAVIAAGAGQGNELYLNVLKDIYHEFGKGSSVPCSLGKCGLRLVGVEDEMVEILAVNCTNFPASMESS